MIIATELLNRCYVERVMGCGRLDSMEDSFTYISLRKNDKSSGHIRYWMVYGDGRYADGEGLSNVLYPHLHNDEVRYFIFGSGYINQELFDTAVVFI